MSDNNYEEGKKFVNYGIINSSGRSLFDFK